MYNEILNNLTKCVKELHNDRLTEIVERANLKANEPQKCNIGVVSDFYGKKTFFKMLERYGISEDVYADYIPDTDVPFVLEVKYGNDTQETTATDKFIDGIKYSEISVTIEQNAVKDFSITFICGINMANLDDRLLYKFSYLFFLTNATMAMPLSAKTWVQEIIVPMFGSDRLTICLYNTNLLNTANDVKALENNVNKLIAKGNWQCSFLSSDEMIENKIAEVISEKETLETKRKEQLVKNCINELKNISEKLLETKNLDLDELRKMVERLDEERKEIEISGKIAIGNVVNNLFTDLKYQLVNAADNYMDDAYKNIHNRISTTDSVTNDIKHIPAYLEKICQLFEKKASEKVQEEYEKITLELARMIENDCKKIMSLVQVPGFEKYFLEANYEFVLTERFGFLESAKSEFDEKVKTNKKLSKGMIVTSVALAFVNPALGISTLIGSRIYNNYRTQETESEARKTVLDGLLSECADLKKEIVAYMSNELSNTQQKTSESLERVYSEIINSLVKAICAAIKEIEKLKKELNMIFELLNNINIIEQSL